MNIFEYRKIRTSDLEASETKCKTFKRHERLKDQIPLNIIQTAKRRPFTPALRPLRFTFLLIFMIIPMALFSQSIGEYQQIAAENNPEVRAAFHDYLAGLEEPDQVGVLQDPEIAFAYFIQPVETRLGPQQARFSFSQMFPWFGTLGNRRDVASFRAKAQFERFQEVRNRIFYQTEKNLFELYELDRSIQIAEENLEILNSLVEISLRRYETNQATQVDVLRAQIEQEDLKTQLALLRDNRNVIVQKINEILNHPDTLQIESPDTLVAGLEISGLQPLKEMLIQQNPDISRLRYLEKSSMEMKELALKDGNPSFGLGVDYILTGERRAVPELANNGDDALIARASIKIPIFRNKYNSNVRQAELNVQSAQSQLASRQNSLETDLEASLRDFYDADRRFELYDQKQIQRINQALNIMMQAYSADSSGFEEILRMQRKLLEYRLNRIRALTDMHRSAAYIDYLTGEHNINPNEL